MPSPRDWLSLEGMRRLITGTLLGAGAGALTAFSHGVAGGAVGVGPLLAVVGVAAVVFAVLPRRLRGLGGLVSVLLVLQLLAHVWLESVHPHAHGGSTSHAHGISGAIAHALTPGMLMMWAHLLAVVVGAAAIVALRPLLEAAIDAISGWWSLPVPSRPAPPRVRWSPTTPASTRRPVLLAYVMAERGPPVPA
jgi:hypothetical protein